MKDIKLVIEQAYIMWQERKISDFDLILIQSQSIDSLNKMIESLENEIEEMFENKC